MLCHLDSRSGYPGPEQSGEAHLTVTGLSLCCRRFLCAVYPLSRPPELSLMAAPIYAAASRIVKSPMMTFALTVIRKLPGDL